MGKRKARGVLRDGATDEFRWAAVEERVDVDDLPATIPHEREREPPEAALEVAPPRFPSYQRGRRRPGNPRAAFGFLDRSRRFS